MTGDASTDDTRPGDDAPSWAALFERAPEHISEATVREMLADHRTGDERPR